MAIESSIPNDKDFKNEKQNVKSASKRKDQIAKVNKSRIIMSL